MIVRHEIKEFICLKGRLHVLDVLGFGLGHKLKPRTKLACVFQRPDGKEWELIGEVAFELVNHKGKMDDENKIGGSLIFEGMPNDENPKGWVLFVHVTQ